MTQCTLITAGAGAGAGGVGLAIAQAFPANGARVHVAGINPMRSRRSSTSTHHRQRGRRTQGA